WVFKPIRVFLKQWHRLRHFRKELDAIGHQIRVIGRSCECNSGAQANEKRAPGIRVKKQRNIRMTLLRVPSSGSAHLEAIVYFEDSRLICALENGDRSHCALAKKSDVLRGVHDQIAASGKEWHEHSAGR